MPTLSDLSYCNGMMSYHTFLLSFICQLRRACLLGKTATHSLLIWKETLIKYVFFVKNVIYQI